MRSFLLIAIPALMFFACARGYIEEIEPNQTKWKAQNIKIPCNIRGIIKQSDDIDFFKFSHTADDDFNISIELKTKRPNPLKLTLYFQDKMIKSVYLLKQEIANNETSIKIKNIFINPGSYYIRINQKREHNGSIPYKLIINRISHNLDEELEPNDTIGEANEINIHSGYIKSYFSPEWNVASYETEYKEVDWFKFFVSGRSNQISIELTGVPGVDPVIELYDELGFFLKKIDGFGIDEPEVLKNYSALHSGYYYVKIYHKNLGEKNDKIPYKLYINIEEHKKEFEFEPNDSISHANILQDKIKGFINPAGDVDWFSFVINENKPVLLNISVTPLSDIDFVINIYNEIGEKLFTLNSYPKNQSEIFPNLYLLSGKYYISVSDFYGNSQNINNAYTLTIKTSIYTENFEVEPNNSLNTATTIFLNKSINGYISPKSDIDYYKFSINTDKKLKFTVSSVPSIDFAIEVYNSKNELLYTINQNKTGEGETGYLELNKGSYYVILKDAEDINSNHYESYILTILER